MTLSDADLRRIAARQEPRVLLHHEVVKFARAIEAEVRKQDDALIRQLVEALEGSISIMMGKTEQRNTALIAGRAWLEHSTQEAWQRYCHTEKKKGPVK